MAVSINGTSGLTFNDGTSVGTASSLGMRNRIINGAMEIDQRNAGAAVTLSTSVSYVTDRWYGTEDTDGTMTAQQSTTAPDGYINSLICTTGTADSSLSATQYAVIGQRIEGLNVADLAWGTAAAKTVTLSFWVRSSLTGTFGGSLRNDAANRSYPFSYTISAANTWEQKSITIAGDTTGTWLRTNGIGIILLFGLGVGSTYSGTAGAWAGSNIFAPTGAVSVIGTAGATFYLTGVQLEVGSVATPFERRLYPQELAMCQRYFFSFQGGSVGFANGSTIVQTGLNFPVPMRATPTLSAGTGLQTIDWSGASAVNPSSISVSTIVAGPSGASWRFNNYSGLTTGQGLTLQGTSSSTALFNAEL